MYLDCRGKPGKLTVLYFHGYIESPSGGGRENGAPIQEREQGKFRFCVYDRANVGRSDAAPGPRTAATSVKDLHALLAAARVGPPYVLLGASFGGLVAFTYAGTYPAEVKGALFLDPVLLNEPSSDQLVPKAFHLRKDDWQLASEQTDYIQSYADAESVAGAIPAVPATLIATKTLSAPDGTDGTRLPGWTAAVRKGQRAFMGRFSPKSVVTVDSEHYMERAIPDRVAGELDAIIGQSH